jgi:transcriptional regulator with XRE-family HTH domain
MTQANERTATLSALVAEEVRALMARRRMSGRQLAASLGVSPSWVSYRLTGQQPIDINDLHLIAKALGVGVHDLLPPPEVAARAQAIAQYLGLPVRTTDRRQRPPDNRPTGHPSPAHPGATGRTSYLDRGPRRPRG